MKYIKLKQLANQWEEMTHTVLALEQIPVENLQNLLKETYKTLVVFHKDELVPKEISKLFLEMEDFLYFSSLMEEKEVGIGYYYYEKVRDIIKALEEGFLNGDFGCEFPKLPIIDVYKAPFIFDFKTKELEDILI